MEQRHQHFIIARVNGRYRNLAAVAQWPYGNTILECCRNTLKILQATTNRLPMEEELKAAERCQEIFWTQGVFEEPEHWDVATDAPFPFLMTCLMLGTTHGLSDGYICAVTIGPWQIKHNSRHPNEGITVFDITDASRVRYCLVYFEDTTTGDPVQLMAPMSARTYFEGYCDVSKLDETSKRTLLSLLAQLQNCSLIPTAVLENTWPCDTWNESDDVQKGLQPVNENLGSLITAERYKATSLRDHAMDKLVQTIVNDPETARKVASEADVLTDFYPRLRGELYYHSKCLRPSPALLDLLYAAFTDEGYVDLSPFHTFNCVDLSLLVSRLQEHGQMTRLNLSNMPNLTNEGLSLVLVSGSKRVFEAVYLMENPQISIQPLCALGCACDLYHSGLLRRFVKQGKYGTVRPPLLHANFAIGENAVTQLVWLTLTREQTLASEYRKPDGSMSWDTLSAEGEPLGSNPLPFSKRLLYNACSLIHVPFSTTRLITGVWNLLEWGSYANVMDRSEVMKIAASSFAIGSSSCSSRWNTSANGVSPFSTEPYPKNAKNFRIVGSDGKSSRLTALRTGQWALLVIQRRWNGLGAKHQMEYALVSPTGDSQATSTSFRTADISSYLDTIEEKDSTFAGQARELRKWWEHNVDEVEAISFYDEKDIHDILRKVYDPAEDSLGMDLKI
ncbi:MAG: hypothetical protein ASARMPRED_005887 [Alectoria sarmentosa]|nr:MAG: hypothetical protein ASARMPRED_005887 [Alectoria sarmentosa]